jgi:hypothetical protein
MATCRHHHRIRWLPRYQEKSSLQGPKEPKMATILPPRTQLPRPILMVLSSGFADLGHQFCEACLIIRRGDPSLQTIAIVHDLLSCFLQCAYIASPGVASGPGSSYDRPVSSSAHGREPWPCRTLSTPVKTGKELRMKESYRKDLASHPGPESCAGIGNDAREVLTGAHVGQVLSCEINRLGVPTLLSDAEGNIVRNDMASFVRTPRSRRP